MTENKINILPEKGTFYKAALHGHSTLSDGMLNPEQIKIYYSERGYQIYAFTDHRVFRWLKEWSDPGFLVLAGYELDYADKENQNAVHLCAIAKDPEHCIPVPGYGPFSEDTVLHAVKQLQKQNFFVTLNHPTWSNMSTEFYMRLGRLVDGIEIYNSLGANIEGYEGDIAYYTYFVRHGGVTIPIAADDCHELVPKEGQITEYGQAFQMIKAETLDYSSVMSALEQGHTYSSNGPLIHSCYLSAGKICVDCSPVRDVYAIDAQLCCPPEHQIHVAGDTITHFEMEIDSFLRRSSFAWIRIKDSAGRFACLPPIRLADYLTGR